MHDIVEFLRTREPFDELDEGALERLAARAEGESYAGGEVILRQGEPGLEHVRIIWRGSVELVDAGRVLDLLEEGGWFGHPAMLSGLPTTCARRGGEDTLCRRLGRGGVVPLLAAPRALRFVVRSLMARPRAGTPAEPRDATARP